jgi:hypothetical protein
MMLVFAMLVALPTGGCMHAQALSKIAAGISDAQVVLDLVQSAVNQFFAMRPKPDAQAKVQEALDRSRLAVGVAIRAANGAQALSDDQLAAAFANFEKAWGELQALLTEFGVSQQDGTFGAGAGGYRSPPIPVPLAVAFARGK